MTTNKTLEAAQILTRKLNGALIEHAIPAALSLDAQQQRGDLPPYAMAPFLTALSASLPHHLAAYAQAQGRVDQEGGEDDIAQDARDVAAGALYTTTSQAARSIESTFGRQTLKAIRLVGTVPSTPDTLMIFTNAFLHATAHPDFVLPDPLNPHASLDFDATRSDIEAKNAALKTALEGVTNDTKQTQSARFERNAAYSAWQRELRFARDSARSILTRTDKAELAARILPTDRQISGDDPVEDPQDGENT